MRCLLAFVLLAVTALPVAAHAPDDAAAHGHWTWTTDPLVLVPLGALAAGYGLGLARLWRRAGRGRGIPVWRAGAFGLGVAALAIALASPLDAAADGSFALHMTQHMLLIVVAAPLLALGNAGVVLLSALPAQGRVRVGRAFAGGALRRVRDTLLAVPVATAMHGLAIWLWHAPGLYEAALADPLVHWLEHLTMLGTGVIFWWSAMSAGRRGPLGHGAGVAALFLTMMHTGLLGILILLAPAPLYASYASGAPLGLAPLEDQQIAGLAMLLPGGIAYLAGGLALLAAWLAAAERRPPLMVPLED